MDDYKIIKRIGEGAHGFVMKASNRNSGREVALKRLIVKNLDEGIPKNIMREILSLQVLSSKYVVQLYDIIAHGMGFILVMEYLPHNLYHVIKDMENPLAESHVKSYMQMLLLGVDYLHENHIMHRDLKPANLLISSGGILKIADLGLARIYRENEKGRKYSHQVATRWYRAPELLYGTKKYTPAVDMWACGCIMGELINRSPLFPGETDIEQLAIVLHTLGTPTSSTWPDMTTLPDYNKITFSFSPGISWDVQLPHANQVTKDLVKSLVQYNYRSRLKPAQALKHAYFVEAPLPCDPATLPKPHQIQLDLSDIEDFNT